MYTYVITAMKLLILKCFFSSTSLTILLEDQLIYIVHLKIVIKHLKT